MATRLCLLVETTTRHKDQWRDIRINIVEPILRALDASPTSELALVLVGVPGMSVNEVLSSQWTRDTQELRRWLDGIDFCGGGNGKGLALAPALLAVACLFGVPSALPSPANHCLMCLISEPGPHPVEWPYPQDCGKVTGCQHLATASELCCAFQRHRFHLAMATRREKPLIRHALLWHLLNMISDAPLDWIDSTTALMEAAKARSALAKSHVVTRGNSLAFFPFWESALRLLQKQSGVRGREQSSGQASMAGGGRSAPPAPAPAPQAPAAAPVAAAAAAAGPALPATAAASPALADVSPGGFWDVMNSELINGPSETLSALSAAANPAHASLAAASPGLYEGPASAGVAGSGPGSLPLPQAVPPARSPLGALYQAGSPPAIVPGAARGGPPGAAPRAGGTPPHLPATQAPVPMLGPAATAPAPAAGPGVAPSAPPVLVWHGQLRMADRVRGAAPALLCTVDAYATAEQAGRAGFGVEAMVIESFLIGQAEARKLAGLLARPGALVVRLLVKEFGPQGENDLRRMGDGQATGQVDLGPRFAGYLTVQTRENHAREQRLVLRLLAVPRA
ncbi:hypothetical protein ACKKBG_A03385 [Auxenochlorella protothecoides x Auxenochlorella symbiontica]